MKSITQLEAMIRKQEELIAYQKKLIYQLDRQPNSIGKEWRNIVEGYEIEIKEISSDLSLLQSAKEEKEECPYDEHTESFNKCPDWLAFSNGCADCIKYHRNKSK